MRSKVMTARPAARKGSGSRTKKAGAVAAAATRRAEPIVQMVERVRAPAKPIAEIPKKLGELPIPLATFVF